MNKLEKHFAKMNERKEEKIKEIVKKFFDEREEGNKKEFEEITKEGFEGKIYYFDEIEIGIQSAEISSDDLRIVDLGYPNFSIMNSNETTIALLSCYKASTNKEFIEQEFKAFKTRQTRQEKASFIYEHEKIDVSIEYDNKSLEGMFYKELFCQYAERFLKNVNIVNVEGMSEEEKKKCQEDRFKTKCLFAVSKEEKQFAYTHDSFFSSMSVPLYSWVTFLEIYGNIERVTA